VSRFAFVDRERARYPVNLLCALLRVSRSGYYAWAGRGPSTRRLADEVLAEQIRGFHTASRCTYGAPRIHDDLRDAGVRVGRKRVARIMREHGLEGVHRRSWRHATTADPAAQPAPDLLDRDFTATAPNQKWVADVTYVPTVAGWLYLAVVLDVFSRRVVGWAMDTHRKTRLVCDAVAMAVANRGGAEAGVVAGVIHHSDRGGEYTSRDLQIALRGCGALASMGSVADCFDNSMAEAFFATLETELFWVQPHRRFTTHRDAKLAIFDYVEVFYNRQRRHTSIGSIPPVTFEARHADHPGRLAA
jgi:putative transposase